LTLLNFARSAQVQITINKDIELGGDSLNVPETVWRGALKNVQLDTIAGIRHAELYGQPSWRLHVAEITGKVNCHFHKCGAEIYEVVEGAGTLYYGRVIGSGDLQNKLAITWEEARPVSTGDHFTIPEGFAHQLVRHGDAPLTIIFACPDTHLGTDRFPLPDAPSLP